MQNSKDLVIRDLSKSYDDLKVVDIESIEIQKKELFVSKISMDIHTTILGALKAVNQDIELVIYLKESLPSSNSCVNEFL
jgi:hypothetical protein